MTAQTTTQILSAFFLVIINILTVCGNTLVCVTFHYYKKLRLKTINYFIVFLAFGDLLVGILVIPYYIATVLQDSEDFYKQTYRRRYPFLYRLWISFDILCGIASIITLVCISIERLTVIMYPFKHKLIFTKKVACLLFITSWIYALVLTTAQFIRPAFVYTIVVSTFGFFIPFIIIFVSYCIIYHIVRKSLLENATNSMSKEWRIARMILLVIGAFTICWLPFFVAILDYSLNAKYLFTYESFTFTKVLHYLNSGVNPLIYGVLNPSYKEAFKAMLQKVGCCKGQEILRTSHSQEILNEPTIEVSM